MRKTLTTLLLGCFSLLIASLMMANGAWQSRSSKLTREEMLRIVTANDEKFGVGFRTANATMIAELYTDNAKFCPPDDRAYQGKERIHEYWRQSLKFIKDMSFTVHSVEGNDNIIYETGSTKTKISYNDSTYFTHEKYVNVWARQADGSFKLDVDIWNADAKVATK